MRAAVDYSNAGFQPLKVQSIAQLGMGASVKFQLQFERRLWNDLGCNGEIRLPVAGLRDDLGRDARAGRHHRRVQLLVRRIPGPVRRRFARSKCTGGLCLAGANEVLPGLPPLWNGLSTLDIWRRNPWSLGSYSFYPPGYQTTLLGIEKQPEGNVFFRRRTYLEPSRLPQRRRRLGRARGAAGGGFAGRVELAEGSRPLRAWNRVQCGSGWRSSLCSMRRTRASRSLIRMP